ncbi:MAG: tRNA (adenosine(37)-N6)-threonylcarbamoyltransferase complex transferase subunit TsaD [Acidobacteriota bacterium]
MKVLGIETSCDETAAAVLDGDDRILSNVVHSQVPVHREFGGVVPELASRHHLQKIDGILDRALEEAGVGLDDLDGIAVTAGPGLVGSLLVGLSYAKAMAWARDLPLVGVNHLEGHIRSAFVEAEVDLPAVFLVVSGGHTNLYHVTGERAFRPLSRTRDDAAGEAYDKVAKLLGLGYPGGPVIDRLARGVVPETRFGVPKMSDGSNDFSFSGIKTAVLYHVRDHEVAPWDGPPDDAPDGIRDLVAGFQEAVVATLLQRTFRAVDEEGARSVAVVGGVACNSRLRERMGEECEGRGMRLVFPRPILCADNAAMIASAGRLRLEAGERAGADLNADPGWQIG